MSRIPCGTSGLDPIEPTSVALLAAAGRSSIRAFQTFVVGRTVQPGAPARTGASAGGRGAPSRIPSSSLSGSSGSVPRAISRTLISPSCVGVLAPVRDTVGVGVGAAGVVPRRCSTSVGEAVVVAVLEAVAEAVVVRVGVPREEPGADVGEAPQAVAVGVLALVADPVAVRVRLARVRRAACCSPRFVRPSPSGFSFEFASRPRPCRPSGGGSRPVLERVREPVRVGVLDVVAAAVAVGVGAPGMGPDRLLLGVGQPVPVGILATVGQLVAVAVGLSGSSASGSSRRVRQAVVVAVGRGQGGGGGEDQRGEGDRERGDAGGPGGPGAGPEVVDRPPRHEGRMDGPGSSRGTTRVRGPIVAAA